MLGEQLLRRLLRGSLRRHAREQRALRLELQDIKAALLRIAGALEQQWPPLPAAPSDVEINPPLDVQYVDDTFTAETMDIELRLTQARGMPPTEEEILQEYDRRHPNSAPAQDGR